MSFEKNNKRYIIVCLILLVLTCGAFFLLSGTMKAGDTVFHVGRIEALAEAIRQGDPFPNIFPDVFDGYGYALPLFYPNFMFYLPALLCAAGVSSLVCCDIFNILLIVLTAALSFYSAKKITDSDFAALYFCFIYMGSGYFAADLINRGALGEVQAYAIAPLALLGIYRAVFGERKRNLPLVLGFLGLLLSHILSLLIFSALFLLFALLNAKAFVREPKRLSSIVCCAALVLLLGGGFFFPFAEQMLTTKFFASYHASIFNPAEAAVGLRNLFVEISPDNFVYTPTLGLPVLAVLIAGVFAVIKKRELFRDELLLGAALCIFASTAYFPWRALDPYLNIIQFPWRMFLPATLFAAMAGALMLKDISRKKLAGAALLACCCAQFLLVGVPEYKKLLAGNEYIGIVQSSEGFEIADENYLHINNDREFWARRDGVCRPEKGELEISRTRDYKLTTVSYSGNTFGDNSIELPLVYYLGYTPTDQDGARLPLSASERGLLSVDIGSGESGEMRVEYTGTALQRFAWAFPLAGLAVSLLIYLKDRQLLFWRKR